MAQTNRFLTEMIKINFKNLKFVLLLTFQKNILSFFNLTAKSWHWVRFFFLLWYCMKEILWHIIEPKRFEPHLSSMRTCVCVCVSECSADSNIERLTSEILVATVSGAYLRSKTFVLKNAMFFVEWSVIKYQLCKAAQTARFELYSWKKKLLYVKIYSKSYV